MKGARQAGYADTRSLAKRRNRYSQVDVHHHDAKTPETAALVYNDEPALVFVILKLRCERAVKLGAAQCILNVFAAWAGDRRVVGIR